MLKGKESEKCNHISRWVTCSLRPPIDFKVVGSQNPRNMLVRRRLDTAVHEWWCSIGFLPVLDMSKLPSQFGRCKGASKGLSGKIPSRPAANVSKPGRITRICCWVVHQNVSSWLHEGYKSDSQAWKRFAMSFDAHALQATSSISECWIPQFEIDNRNWILLGWFNHLAMDHLWIASVEMDIHFLSISHHAPAKTRWLNKGFQRFGPPDILARWVSWKWWRKVPHFGSYAPGRQGHIKKRPRAGKKRVVKWSRAATEIMWLIHWHVNTNHSSMVHGIMIYVF